MKRISLCLLALSLLIFPLKVSAQNPRSNNPANYFKPTLKRVAIFKNGYVFTYREGEAQMLDGWAYTTETPIGVMGTVWGYTTGAQGRVAQLTVGESDKTETARVASFAELLLANEGTRVKVKGLDRYYEGELIALTPRRQPIVTTNLNGDIITTQTPVTLTGEYDIALKTAEGLFVIRSSAVTQIELLGATRLDKTVTSKETRLMFKTDGAGGGARIGLGVAALERGIRWIPAYRIQLIGEPAREAKVELEAMVINELADLENTEVHFVVGVPHFLYKEIMSPLSLSSTFAGVSSYFRTNTNAYSNAIMTQSRAGEMRRRADGDEGGGIAVGGDDEQLPATNADELFLYRAENFSLKRNERASLRLFSLNVPCSEVYEWDVPDSTGDDYGAGGVQNLANGIWFGVKLKNQTGMPWTTAPALSFRDWKPLGQDMLGFTPVGSDVFVRVSPATEVIGSHRLEEKSRVREAVRVQRNVTDEYDAVTVEGIIKLRNVKKQPVNIILKRRVAGAVSAASDGGTPRREATSLEALNPNTVVRWELTIPPGEKELRYTYKTYVKR